MEEGARTARRRLAHWTARSAIQRGLLSLDASNRSYIAVTLFAELFFRAVTALPATRINPRENRSGDSTAQPWSCVTGLNSLRRPIFQLLIPARSANLTEVKHTAQRLQGHRKDTARMCERTRVHRTGHERRRDSLQLPCGCHRRFTESLDTARRFKGTNRSLCRKHRGEQGGLATKASFFSPSLHTCASLGGCLELCSDDCADCAAHGSGSPRLSGPGSDPPCRAALAALRERHGHAPLS